MTISQRILSCREFAQEAEMMARTAHPDNKHEYKKIAGEWHLAAELEIFGRTDAPLPRRAGGAG